MAQEPHIVVLDDWENSLRDHIDWSRIRQSARVTIHNRTLRGQALTDALRDAAAVVLLRERTPFPGELIARLPALRLILCTGVRNRTLDSDAAQAAGIRVLNTGGGPGKASTCELTWTLILAASRRLTDLALSAERPLWRDPEVSAHLPPVLEGRRLGLVGLGEIGQRVAAVGKAFGMDVATWSPNMTAERAAAHGVAALPLEELLGTSDIVSLHLVPSAATRHLIDAERLALMKPASLLVNTSRAELIDTGALVDALKDGRIGGCALDVFDEEPLPADHPLLSLRNALLTPHYGFVCEEVMHCFARDVESRLLAWLDQS